MDKLYIIEWRNSDARYYVDIIPQSFLETFVALRKQTHPMVGRLGEVKDDVIIATCDVEPLPDGSLLLRYGGDNAAANAEADVYVGDVRINRSHFEGATTLDWRGPEDADFTPLPVKVAAVFSEGSKKSATRLIPDRSSYLRTLVHALGQHRGECEACGIKPHPGYGDAGSAMFEAHHIAPLRKGPRLTGLADLAYLCANCHRVITRMGDPDINEFIQQIRDAAK